MRAVVGRFGPVESTSPWMPCAKSRLRMQTFIFLSSSTRWRQGRRSSSPDMAAQSPGSLPEAGRRQEDIDRAIGGIKRLRARTGRITTEELLSSRHEGHRY